MNDLERRLNNLCQVGLISEVDNSKFIARVKLNDRTTDFFKVFSQEGAFKKTRTPLRVGEQVMVLCPFGNANIGFILRGIAGDSDVLSGGDDDDITEYSDGTKIVKSSNAFTITSPTAVVILASNFSIDNGGNLNINGEITDTKGNLTTHTHDVFNHVKAIERN